MNYDIVAIASLLFGISYGGIELSCDIIFKEIAGIRQWKNIRDPLEIISGLLSIGIYGIISALDINLFKILGGNTAACMLLASIWLYIVMSK